MTDLSIIQLTGELPFVLLMKDSIDENNNLNDGIEIIIDNISGLFFHKRHVREYKDQQVIIASEDIHGYLTYSSFALIFTEDNAKNLYDLAKDEKGEFNHQVLMTKIVEFIRKLVTAYRTVSKKDWIGPIGKSDLNSLRLVIKDIPNAVSIDTILGYKGTGVMIGSNLNEKDDGEICNMCSLDFTINTAYKYLQEANRYKIHQEYESFTLFLASYIESWIYREIELKMLHDGKSVEEIDILFKDSNGGYKMLQVVMRDRWKEVYETTIKNSKEFKDYIKLVHNRRNSIAHGRGARLTECDSEEMIKAAIVYRDFLSPLIWA